MPPFFNKKLPLLEIVLTQNTTLWRIKNPRTHTSIMLNYFYLSSTYPKEEVKGVLFMTEWGVVHRMGAGKGFISYMVNEVMLQ